jgi:hypothetical protein
VQSKKCDDLRRADVTGTCDLRMIWTKINRLVEARPLGGEEWGSSAKPDEYGSQ